MKTINGHDIIHFSTIKGIDNQSECVLFYSGYVYLPDYGFYYIEWDNEGKCDMPDLFIDVAKI